MSCGGVWGERAEGFSGWGCGVGGRAGERVRGWMAVCLRGSAAVPVGVTGAPQRYRSHTDPSQRAPTLLYSAYVVAAPSAAAAAVQIWNSDLSCS